MRNRLCSHTQRCKAFGQLLEYLHLTRTKVEHRWAIQTLPCFLGVPPYYTGGGLVQLRAEGAATDASRFSLSRHLWAVWGSHTYRSPATVRIHWHRHT